MTWINSWIFFQLNPFSPCPRTQIIWTVEPSKGGLFTIFSLCQYQIVDKDNVCVHKKTVNDNKRHKSQ